LYYFHKKLKIKKNQKTFLLGFYRCFFCFFLVGFLLPTLGTGGVRALWEAVQYEARAERASAAS
jgi:hypothetical protein